MKELSGELQNKLITVLYSPCHKVLVEDCNHNMKKERVLQHIDDLIKACAIAKDFIEKEEIKKKNG